MRYLSRNAWIAVALIGIACIGLLTWLLRARDDGSSNVAERVTVLLPEAANLERSIVRYYLEELRGWLTEYEREHPNSLDIVTAPYDAEGTWYDQKLSVMTMSGSEPDVIFVIGDRLQELAASGRVANLGDVGLACRTGVGAPVQGANEVAERSTCMGLPHPVLPDYYYAILSGTDVMQHAVELLAFLGEKGSGG